MDRIPMEMCKTRFGAGITWDCRLFRDDWNQCESSIFITLDFLVKLSAIAFEHIVNHTSSPKSFSFFLCGLSRHLGCLFSDGASQGVGKKFEMPTS